MTRDGVVIGANIGNAVLAGPFQDIWMGMDYGGIADGVFDNWGADSTGYLGN